MKLNLSNVSRSMGRTQMRSITGGYGGGSGNKLKKCCYINNPTNCGQCAVGNYCPCACTIGDC